MRYGDVRKRVDAAASLYDSLDEESPTFQTGLAVAQVAATLAIAEANLELARVIEQHALEVRRMVHLR